MEQLAAALMLSARSTQEALNRPPGPVQVQVQQPREHSRDFTTPPPPLVASSGVDVDNWCRELWQWAQLQQAMNENWQGTTARCWMAIGVVMSHGSRQHQVWVASPWDGNPHDWVGLVDHCAVFRQAFLTVTSQQLLAI